MGEQAVSAEQLVRAVISDFPDHIDGLRPVHTYGLGLTGHFVAADVAPRYCRAEHLSGRRIPVTVRFSSGSGGADRHDERPDVRGMATRFHLADDAATDLIAMTLGVFFVRTPEQFLQFTASGIPQKDKPEGWFAKLRDVLRLRLPGQLDPKFGEKESGTKGLATYAGSHSFARAGVVGAGLAGVPASWARAKYHAVHTFVIENDEGARRWVRFAWQPVAGVYPLDQFSIQPEGELATDFLADEMRSRLTRQPVRFVLKMTIADPGDAVDDPTIPWPVTRKAVMMGMLVLTDIADDQSADCERMSFNPMRMTPGIEPSDDPILRARKEAYEWSASERDALPCPFHDASMTGSAVHGSVESPAPAEQGSGA